MKRAHPICIFENLSRYFWLFLFPLIRSLVIFDGGFFYWLSGAWFDLLIVAAIFGFAVLRWLFTGYSLLPDGIRVRKGILIQKDLIVRSSSLSSVCVTVPFFYRPFRAVRVQGDSDAGRAKRCDFSLVLSPAAAEEMRHAIRRTEGRNRNYQTGGKFLALFAFVSSKSFVGVIFVFTLLTQSGRIFGRTFQTMIIDQLTGLARSLAFGIPPAAAYLGLLIFLGWLASFLINLLRNARFSVKRRGNSLHIGAGILTRYRRRIDIRRITQLELRQSPLMKLLRVSSVFLRCAGYGKAKNELAVLFPVVGEKERNTLLSDTMPEWQVSENTLRPSAGALLFFLGPPAAVGALIAAAASLFGIRFPEWSEMAAFLGWMFEIPVLWWMVARAIGFRHTGASGCGETRTMRYVKGLALYTAIVRKEKILGVTYRKSPVQRFTGRCTVIVEIWGEKRIRHKIPGLLFEEAEKLFR